MKAAPIDGLHYWFYPGTNVTSGEWYRFKFLFEHSIGNYELENTLTENDIRFFRLEARFNGDPDYFAFEDEISCNIAKLLA